MEARGDAGLRARGLRGKTAIGEPPAAEGEHMSRRLLQIAVSISALQAVLGGGFNLVVGVAALSYFAPSPLPVDTSDPVWSSVDYMYRALAGIWLSLGLMFAYMVPAIEKHGAWFFLACLGIFGMGIGRLASSMVFVPAPANSFEAMIAEFVIPPLLILWQRRVARADASGGVEDR
jgi:hypothetical protein